MNEQEKGIKNILKNKTLIAIIWGLITTIALGANLDKTIPVIMNSGNDVMLIVYFAITSLLFYHTLQVKDKRASICAVILGVVFATCQVLGYSIRHYQDLSGVLSSGITITSSIIKWLGYTSIFYGLIFVLFTKVMPKLKEVSKKEFKFFTNNKRSFFILIAVFLLAYLPYFLAEFPGIVSPDSASEMRTGLGLSPSILNHHPVFHILLVAIPINIGKLIGSYTAGIGLYSIIQMVATASVFSYAIYYMAKKKVNIYVRILLALFFALYPPFAAYSVTMWKDVPFGLIMVLYVICLIELATNRKEFLGSIKNNIIFFITMLFVMLLRNNGIYVLLITIPFMIFFAKEYRKTMVILSGLVIISYIIFKGPIFSLLHIQDGPARESLSVPLQQFARVERDRAEDLSDEDRQAIHRFLPVDDLGAKYYPLISDTVKDELDNEYFKEHKGEFVKLWVKLFFRYPKTYVESFFCNSFGYWYPEEANWIISKDFVTLNIIGYNKRPIINPEPFNQMKDDINKRKIPVVSMLFSIGFICWVVFTCLVYIIYKKQYRLLLIFIPIVALWLTTVASPVWCEFRYVYSIFTTLPFTTLVAIQLANREKEEEK